MEGCRRGTEESARVERRDRDRKWKRNSHYFGGEGRLVPFFFIFPLVVVVFLFSFVVSCRFLRFLLRSGNAVSDQGDTMHACAMGSFYRFPWFPRWSRGGVPEVALSLHQHATQNSLAYRRNRVAFSRLTYTYICRTSHRHRRKCR